MPSLFRWIPSRPSPRWLIAIGIWTDECFRSCKKSQQALFRTDTLKQTIFECTPNLRPKLSPVSSPEDRRHALFAMHQSRIIIMSNSNPRPKQLSVSDPEARHRRPHSDLEYQKRRSNHQNINLSLCTNLFDSFTKPQHQFEIPTHE